MGLRSFSGQEKKTIKAQIRKRYISLAWDKVDLNSHNLGNKNDFFMSNGQSRYLLSTNAAAIFMLFKSRVHCGVHTNLNSLLGIMRGNV